MSHHFRLAKGIPHVVDATPPHSMYNSPISIHYLPKRASSADPFKRKALSKSQRELTDFVNGRNGDPHGLRLPLPIRSSLTDLVKPKLLENRNYQPPRRKTPSKDHHSKAEENSKKAKKLERINKFKDAVLTDLIENDTYSDQMIMNSIRRHMEKLAGVISWDDLEKAADELIKKIGLNTNVQNSRRSSRSRDKNQRFNKPPLPYKVERIGSAQSLESLSSPSSSSAKTSSSSSSSSFSTSSQETNSSESS
ncbi:uncharacterized protein CELE_ZK682.7 [Caenorhabditis elegans]|uniref:Uncharacterized protein n=1 Tax=Caenorhabditis elegans TaxID=6239 RepID=Q23581_CAEEL|nr:Uncharacterized protein CELE_ZK682.7 [Caenorhabditis elegans]CCD69800.1 Uncharacterized protein CELE_ZK682.7 [Caenorhabditis elegans]|eukprot:NP_505403.2 Uncharacterized protein CELE_ZK682.7 [Caenorhabditis elegans]